VSNQNPEERGNPSVRRNGGEGGGGDVDWCSSSESRQSYRDRRRVLKEGMFERYVGSIENSEKLCDDAMRDDREVGEGAGFIGSRGFYGPTVSPSCILPLTEFSLSYYGTSAMYGSKRDHISPQNSTFAHKYIHTW